MDGVERVNDEPRALDFIQRRWDFQSRWNTENDTPARWRLIREAYEWMLPEIEKAGRRGRGISPYIFDWDFTPIERYAWQDIRPLALPLYPQFPVDRYFIDFADPVKKIGVELDGKAFHDEKVDRIRDARLWDLGWRIFRIPGFKSLPSGAPIFDQYDWRQELKCDEDLFLSRLSEWASRWSEGIFWAIKFVYYTSPTDQQHQFSSAAYRSLSVNRYAQFPIDPPDVEYDEELI